MTIKERIEAFVLNQGNQVGAGAELAAILNDIVDSIPGAYTLPPATAETLGGIKVGENLSITEQGVLNTSGGGAEPLIVNVSDLTLDDTQDIFYTTVYTAPYTLFSRMKTQFSAGGIVLLMKEGLGQILTRFDEGTTLLDEETPVECFRISNLYIRGATALYGADFIVEART